MQQSLARKPAIKMLFYITFPLVLVFGSEALPRQEAARSDLHDNFANSLHRIVTDVGDNRIIGGYEAEDGEFPHMVSFGQ